jgi:hypothetical protein
MSYVRQGLLLLCCMMLCGCVIMPNYPSSWAPLESARQDCFSVGGVYHNQGQAARYGAPDLAPRLFQETSDKALFKLVDRVEVAVTKEGTLEVTALNLSRPVMKKQLFANKDEFRCDDGKIEIAGFFVDWMGARQQSVILSKSIDGALVVKDGATGLGFFVIPITGFDWQRYKPISWGKPESQPKPDDDVVNCVAGGELRWTDRSKCD